MADMNQPEEYDAVLGGTQPSPIYGAVLGGIDGIKERLASPVLEVRSSALSDALKYGEAGLDLVLQALQDQSRQVQLAAYSLLKDIQELKVKQQLENFDDLTSDVEVDYCKLRDLLAAGKWSEADQETTAVMLKAARTQEDWLDIEDIENFPCADLRTINQLWIKYSKGLFGFSVQKQIWQELGAKVNYETNCRLGDHIGWRANGIWGNPFGIWVDYGSGHFPTVALLCQMLPYWPDDYYPDWAVGWGAWRVTGWSGENGFADYGYGAVRFISYLGSRLINCGI